VHGDRVAREGVDGQNVEAARRLALQHQPRVAQHDLGRRGAARQEREVRARQPLDLRVDLVEAVEVPCPPMRGHHAGA